MKKILLLVLFIPVVISVNFAFGAPPMNTANKAELAKKEAAPDVYSINCPKEEQKLCLATTIAVSGGYVDLTVSIKKSIKKAEADPAADAVSLGVDATADIVASNAKTQTQPCPKLSNAAQPDCVQLE